jgi:hypothetical protein
MRRSFKGTDGMGGKTSGNFTEGKIKIAWGKAGPEQTPRNRDRKRSVRRTGLGRQPMG